MKTDSLFYRLFQTFPRLLFDLIAQPPEHAPQYQFSSVELKQTAFRVDGVFLPPAEHLDWPLFFVEVQFQSDPDLYARLFTEIFLYLRYQRPRHPWHAVVILRVRSIRETISITARSSTATTSHEYIWMSGPSHDRRSASN